MSHILNFPRLLFVFSLVTLWLATQIGAFFAGRLQPLKDGERDDFNLVVNASLTLLALIIGFSFSMAVTRYDQRKNYEEEEANAIGTEYVRADLLPAADAAKVRGLLKKYTDERILFYTTHDAHELEQINTSTAQLQNELWSAVQGAAVAQPTPTVALAAAGMNDVLNSQGYTQAAWWNRLPAAAWGLMGAIAVCCNLLVGFGSRRRGVLLFTILPLVVSIAFFLIADIDSPRTGVIRVLPQNLIALSQSLRAQ